MLCHRIDPSSSQEFIQGQLLEHHLRLASFIDDTDMLIVHAGQARIARPSTFVEQHVVRLRPCSAIVKAYLNRVMRAPLLCVRVRKQQHMLPFTGVFVIDTQVWRLMITSGSRQTKTPRE